MMKSKLRSATEIARGVPNPKVTEIELSPEVWSDNSKMIIRECHWGLAIETHDCLGKVANMYTADEIGLKKFQRMIEALKEAEKHLKIRAEKGHIRC